MRIPISLAVYPRYFSASTGATLERDLLLDLDFLRRGLRDFFRERDLDLFFDRDLLPLERDRFFGERDLFLDRDRFDLECDLRLDLDLLDLDLDLFLDLERLRRDLECDLDRLLLRFPFESPGEEKLGSVMAADMRDWASFTFFMASSISFAGLAAAFIIAGLEFMAIMVGSIGNPGKPVSPGIPAIILSKEHTPGNPPAIPNALPGAACAMAVASSGIKPSLCGLMISALSTKTVLVRCMDTPTSSDFSNFT